MTRDARTARTRTPPLWVIGLWAAAAAIFGALSACGPGSKGAAKGAATYDGPAARVESAGGQHVVVFTAPSAGWEFRFDRTRPVLGATEVYVTAIRPNPAYMHAQGMVEQRIGSTVPAASPVAVFVRVLEYGRDRDDAPYRLAARSAR